MESIVATSIVAKPIDNMPKQLLVAGSGDQEIEPPTENFLSFVEISVNEQESETDQNFAVVQDQIQDESFEIPAEEADKGFQSVLEATSEITPLETSHRAPPVQSHETHTSIVNIDLDAMDIPSPPRLTQNSEPRSSELPATAPAPTLDRVSKDLANRAQPTSLDGQSKEALSEVAVRGRSSIELPLHQSPDAKAPFNKRVIIPNTETHTFDTQPKSDKSHDRVIQTGQVAIHDEVDVNSLTQPLVKGKFADLTPEHVNARLGGDDRTQALEQKKLESPYAARSRSGTEQEPKRLAPQFPSVDASIRINNSARVGSTLNVIADINPLDDAGTTRPLEIGHRGPPTALGSTNTMAANPNGQPEGRAVAMQVAGHFSNQTTRTTVIRLDPEELGQVRMTLRSTDTGMTMVIIAERPETSEMMRRSIHELAEEFRSLGYEKMEFQFGEPPPDQRTSQNQGDFSTDAELQEEVRPVQPETRQLDGRLNIRL